MAFVARRSSDGSVVDRQQVSGRSTMRPLSLSDISDEDSESVLGYTNRTYGAPTVRYVGQGEGETDIDGGLGPETKEDHNGDAKLPFEDSVEDPADVSGSETDSILSFCQQLEEEEANDAMRSSMMNFTDEDAEDELVHDVDAENEEDQKSMGRGDDATVTDTETVMNFDQDVLSLSSFGSCTPTVTQRAEDLENLDSLSGRTFFKEDVMEDNISSKTFFKQDKSDALSGRTSFKQTAFKDKRQRSPVDLESDQGQLSSRTYNVSNRGSTRGSNRGSDRGSHRLHDGSSLSTCSWSDMYGGALQPSDGRSNIVPSLSLASANSDTSTYFKSLEENRERQGQEAFESWKARKAAQKQKTLLAAKKEQEKREAEAALRQKLSQERFQEWCRRKEEQQQKQQKQQQQILRKKTTTSSQSSSGNSSASSFISGYGSTSGSGSSAGPVKKLPPEVTTKRIKEWERIKMEQQQCERERLRRLQDNKQKLEEERRKRSQGAWKNWMKQVDKRAKPVPLNQGFDTLRGTISNIYINPHQWVSNIDPQDSGRSR
ncbi:probable serine/threonine-protein kinase yakA [Drosophila biarmipes]|uniref:probable serine/threonine-protein kinase yakA n=1 Tax=Drosophila biarmipes TaxID=125945 RepID=UPI0007E5DD32|nr:probable serine/threonine-protein kinase yakA [Drosophila biarmipes]